MLYQLLNRSRKGFQTVMNPEKSRQGAILWHSELRLQGNKILFLWFVEAAGWNRIIT
jgi:hypothetical protein